MFDAGDFECATARHGSSLSL